MRAGNGSAARFMKLRQERALTLREIAEPFGLTTQAVWTWELEGVPRRHLTKLAALLGVSVAELRKVTPLVKPPVSDDLGPPLRRVALSHPPLSDELRREIAAARAEAADAPPYKPSLL